MSTLLEDFVGVWKIQWVAGVKPFFQRDWLLVVGNGESTTEGQNFVSFKILDEGGNEQPLEPEAEGPLEAFYTGETLQWCGRYAGQPARLFASLARVESYKSLYGASIFGDPDQVAVWGGGAGTPPDPPPPPAGG